ncbi:probable ATP-dependent RNA helicase ddx42 [Trichoplusia ni]|uniref:Probable ATP-dependent RNA helicase ddx42 n=1 Tax=Trichoplusia ni TaxID=7111 RepID=A0A7E5WET6_TRINI|nr:probable ATP-dependent RNA helicase ddx42 [Trichoplusia ni]
MTISSTTMVAVAVNMCLIKYHVLILCLIVAECYALNCRSDGGPKEAELKNIYKKCLKMQTDNKNSSKGNSDQDWKEARGQQRNDWDRTRTGSKENRNRKEERLGRDRMDSSGMRDNKDDMMGSRADDRMDRNYERKGNDNQRGRNNDRTSNNNSNDKTGNRSKNNRNEMTGNRENGRNDFINGREDFQQSDEYETDMSKYNNYHSTQPPRRYKRDRRPENSGKRSQYNPNAQRINGYEDNSFRSEERNSSENNSSRESDNKACALHCFLENLEMTGEDGMPDRYLVTHAITKNVKNEDLKDFLQESIEECFQILDNENTEDKCEFSKNLLLCLSEKGRSNCDDWKEDLF